MTKAVSAGISRNKLLARLDEIGKLLAASGHALALIGLGSVGLETERLDRYSDLDFFAIVEDGYKIRYLRELEWLSGAGRVAYAFQNTADGYKLLYADGIFCEFAVFERGELSEIPFAPGRIVWKAEGVPENIALPANRPMLKSVAEPGWLVGEALTNLYVGLCRYRRGEKLSAQRFIQQYAVDRVLALLPLVETVAEGGEDPFTAERRVEQRYPDFARHLAKFVQGYDASPQAALEILSFLEARFEVNQAIADQIRSLASNPGTVTE